MKDMTPIEIVARRIIVRWDEWDAEAQAASQLAQDSDAGDAVLVGYLMGELSALVGQGREFPQGEGVHA